MEKTELEAICQEILGFEDVTLGMFFNRDSEIVCMKTNVEFENWVLPKEELEKRAITLGLMISEIADSLTKHIGRTQAFVLFHEKRYTLVFPANELFLVVVTTPKISGLPLIHKIRKIIDKANL